eukprot:CAMPEP_0117666432 /NCGR_PEP_ID=MMETSP0804-20121206/10373_1 /TAXON_ID=1074897 /ORGANISM="Tetraselmis astigmatica, Strain CCMP880" /LENGTH=616 /DNA_ID=CAMNT_0005473977 /DNA_START=199 /DNA_END=2049 /DNA_ORIENTATION=-
MHNDCRLRKPFFVLAAEPVFLFSERLWRTRDRRQAGRTFGLARRLDSDIDDGFRGSKIAMAAQSHPTWAPQLFLIPTGLPGNDQSLEPLEGVMDFRNDGSLGPMYGKRVWGFVNDNLVRKMKPGDLCLMTSRGTGKFNRLATVQEALLGDQRTLGQRIWGTEGLSYNIHGKKREKLPFKALFLLEHVRSVEFDKTKTLERLGYHDLLLATRLIKTASTRASEIEVKSLIEELKTILLQPETQEEKAMRRGKLLELNRKLQSLQSKTVRSSREQDQLVHLRRRIKHVEAVSNTVLSASYYAPAAAVGQLSGPSLGAPPSHCHEDHRGDKARVTGTSSTDDKGLVEEDEDDDSEDEEDMGDTDNDEDDDFYDPIEDEDGVSQGGYSISSTVHSEDEEEVHAEHRQERCHGFLTQCSASIGSQPSSLLSPDAGRPRAVGLLALRKRPRQPTIRKVAHADVGHLEDPKPLSTREWLVRWDSHPAAADSWVPEPELLHGQRDGAELLAQGLGRLLEGKEEEAGRLREQNHGLKLQANEAGEEARQAKRVAAEADREALRLKAEVLKAERTADEEATRAGILMAEKEVAERRAKELEARLGQLAVEGQKAASRAAEAMEEAA